MDNLQLVLTGGNGRTTDLSIHLSENEQSYLVFLGMALLERVPQDKDHLMYKLMIARLANSGLSLRELERVFNHDHRTLSAWGDALRSGDLEKMVKVFSGQRAQAKVTPQIAEFVKSHYLAIADFYHDYRQRIRQAVLQRFGVELSRETLRLLFAEARDEQRKPDGVYEVIDDVKPSENELNSTADFPAEVHENGEMNCSNALNPNSTDGLNDKFSPAPETSVGTVKAEGILDRFTRDPQMPPQLLHHVGHMLFLPWFSRLGEGRPGNWKVHEQWLAQLLQGAVNVEQSKGICLNSLALLTGVQCANRNRQRKELKEQADWETVHRILEANARVLADGPGKGKVFYYDVHSVEYTGMDSILKGWCGKRHSIVKVLHLDFVHTRSGAPCYVFHADNYYDLRERFFMVVNQFNRLFDESHRHGRTWVIDRGIFGLDTFDAIRESGDFLITWEKGYARGGWDNERPTTSFRKIRERNRMGDLLAWDFQCQESPWRRDPGMRQILVRVRPPTPGASESEVSILCDNALMPLTEVVTAMFDRWIQENDFWYMDTYMGINQITGYGSHPYDQIADQLQDRESECPDYRELKRCKQNVDKELAKILLRRERLNDQIQKLKKESVQVKADRHSLFQQAKDQLSTLGAPESPPQSFLDTLDSQLRRVKGMDQTLRKLTKRHEKLEERLQTQELLIGKLKAEADRLMDKINQTLRQDSRLKLLIAENYRRIDMRKKAVMDALRITARNIFFRLHEQFRPIYNNYRDDHVMLRILTRASGLIRIDKAAGKIDVLLWLKGHFSAATRTRFDTFLAAASTFINHLLTSTIPVRFGLLGSENHPS